MEAQGFLCPSADKDKCPTFPAGTPWEGHRCAYVYQGKPLIMGRVPFETPLVWDAPGNHKGDRSNVLRLDGSVQLQRTGEGPTP